MANAILVYRPIVLDNDTVGTIGVEMDRQPMQARLRGFGTVAVVVGLAAGAIVLLVIFRLQRIISEPILTLAEAAQQVAENKDYSVRVQQASQDEIGVLNRTFNDMLSIIEHRDEQLTRARNDLEERVKQRTMELETEVHQRKRAQESLGASEKRFRAMIENGSDIIAIMEADSRLVYASPSVQSVLGWTPEDVVGSQLLHHLHPDTSKVLSDILEETTTQTRKSVSTVLKCRAADGSWRDLEAHFTNLSGDQAVQGVVANMRDITDRMSAEAQLRASLQEKEVLLKEIHHRVKNNMQVVTSLINLQARKTTDPTALALLRDSQTRVKSMALIHEKLYQSSDLAAIDFHEYVTNLLRFLQSTYVVSAQNVKLVCEVDSISLGVDIAVPCGLIINELVSNSLKYAFSHSADNKVIVSCHKRDDAHIVLTVSDNGDGFPDDVDFRDRDSLGLKLVHNLTNQLSGELTLDTTNGTRFTLCIPHTLNDRLQSSHEPQNTHC